jgi:phosphoglucosamine mutase
MTLKFGTDGVRGHADELDDAFVFALGRAAAVVLGPEADGRFVVGRDTRESGPRLERALHAGLRAGGATVEVLGVVPTPAVAARSAAQDVAAAMISASHNAYGDNGIKFFAAGGLKLSDAVEAQLEHVLDGLHEDLAGGGRAFPEPALDAALGPIDAAGHVQEYDDLVIGSLEGRRLDDLRVVIDCANGASAHIAPDLLRRLGADVTVLHAEPDGRNINEACGSTHPESLQAAVVAHGAALGLAFDGDADRVLAVDETGALVDGDHLIALCAIDLRERGALVDDTVVVTVMTNLGFRIAMAERGIKVVETQVGDRYVLEALEAGGYVIGGEQSGHVIFRRIATTGDGLLTGVQVLDLVRRAGRPFSHLAAECMTQLPQVLKNVRVAHRDPDVAAHIADDIRAVEAELGATGRVLVRASGTEPLVRVMIEAPDAALADALADRLIDAVVRVCGGH